VFVSEVCYLQCKKIILCTNTSLPIGGCYSLVGTFPFLRSYKGRETWMLIMYIERKIYTGGSTAYIGIVKGHIVFIFVIINHTTTLFLLLCRLWNVKNHKRREQKTSTQLFLLCNASILGCRKLSTHGTSFFCRRRQNVCAKISKHSGNKATTRCTSAVNNEDNEILEH
jgi:hypothetical protein